MSAVIRGHRNTILWVIAACKSSVCPLALVISLLISSNHAGPPASRRLTPIPPPHYLEVRNFLETRCKQFSELQIKALTRTILNEAKRSGIEPVLILGLIHVESSGNPMAVSSVGALGLMQLRPATAEAMATERAIPWEGPESLFDPNLNVILGVHYLDRMIDRFGDVDTALAAYNWGPTRIARVIRSGRSVPAGYTKSVYRAYSALI
jgi:soluble lytic murein transglycosylase-like protein